MSTPPEKLADSIGLYCQTCESARPDIVVVNLLTGESDIQCYPCHVAMMTAALAELAATVPDEPPADPPVDIVAAMEAAQAALAAE